MATAADLIRRSLQLLGVLASAEPLSAGDQADGLVELNLLLGTWANERLLVQGTQVAAYTLTPNLSPHSIGPVGGTLIGPRPVRIDGAGIIPAGSTVETPLKLLTDEEWRDVSDKTQTGPVPFWLWYGTQDPLGHVWLWPAPTTAARLVLYTWVQIAQFAATDVIALPAGYENALAHALALQWSPMFGVEPSASLVQSAEAAVSAIKRTNMRPEYLRCDPAVTGGGGFNLVSGDG